MDNMNGLSEAYQYHVYYRGVLASRKLTRLGAKKLADKQMREKGWAPADLRIVLVEPESVSNLVKGVN